MVAAFFLFRLHPTVSLSFVKNSPSRLLRCAASKRGNDISVYSVLPPVSFVSRRTGRPSVFLRSSMFFLRLDTIHTQTVYDPRFFRPTLPFFFSLSLLLRTTKIRADFFSRFVAQLIYETAPKLYSNAFTLPFYRKEKDAQRCENLIYGGISLQVCVFVRR